MTVNPSYEPLGTRVLTEFTRLLNFEKKENRREITK